MHKFRNETGATVPKYGILKIGDPVVTPTDNENQWKRVQSFEGETPTTDCDFAITQESYKSTADALKPCVVSGTSPCTINVTDAAHTHAVAGTTVDKLVSATSGPAKILWKESGTGDKNAFVLLGQSGTSSETRNWCTGKSASNSFSGNVEITDFKTSDESIFYGSSTGGGFFNSVWSTVDCVGFMTGTWSYSYPESDVLYATRAAGGLVALAMKTSSNPYRRASFAEAGPAMKQELYPITLAQYAASDPLGTVPTQTVGFGFSTPIEMVNTGQALQIIPRVDIAPNVLLPGYENESFEINFALVQTDLPELSSISPFGGVNPQG